MIRNNLRQTVTAGIAGQTDYTSLSSIGITTGAIGASITDDTDQIQIDSTKLAAALAANPDAVKQLQERLRAEGFFTYATSTGYFGPITFAAVQAYQTKHGIPSTGFVGPLTIAELNK